LEGEKPRERQFSARGAALRQRTQVAAHDGVRAERASADAGPRPVTDLFFQDRTVDSTESMLTFSSVLLFTEI
jgi:hypothetical protein